ncbi:hypothetical protein [Natronorubrum halophilum]|uniref:hypothetical protein n=1 Tax=Natronorubrum halophilum TaxID=1702106 RepID=UPI0010C21310|nr:hypothetical protein [Natronorubrum halophilum]
MTCQTMASASISLLSPKSSAPSSLNTDPLWALNPNARPKADLETLAESLVSILQALTVPIPRPVADSAAIGSFK